MDNTTLYAGCFPPSGGSKEMTRQEVVEGGYLGENGEAVMVAAEAAWVQLQAVGVHFMEIAPNVPEDMGEGVEFHLNS